MISLEKYIGETSKAAFAREHDITRQRVHEMIKQGMHVHEGELWLRSTTRLADGRLEDSEEVHDQGE